MGALQVHNVRARQEWPQSRPLGLEESLPAGPQEGDVILEFSLILLTRHDVPSVPGLRMQVLHAFFRQALLIFESDLIRLTEEPEAISDNVWAGYEPEAGPNSLSSLPPAPSGEGCGEGAPQRAPEP